MSKRLTPEELAQKRAEYEGILASTSEGTFVRTWERAMDGLRLLDHIDALEADLVVERILNNSDRRVIDRLRREERERRKSRLRQDGGEPEGGIMSDLKARAELWEADEYIIVVGPIEGTQKAWSWGSPIGPTLSKNAALAVERWLNAGALREIVRRTREGS